MLSRRGRRKLLDIRENGKLARDWIEGMSASDFAADVKTFYAVTRALEVISEASRGIDLESKARFSHLPWGDIAGAGNIYRHDYEEVSAVLVWKTVAVALSPLLAAVEAELHDED